MNRRLLRIFLLALLLPLAQVAAAAHEVSHLPSRTESGSKSAPQASHCDLCAVAAAVAGGGAATSSPSPVPIPQAVETPIASLPAAAATPAFFAFQSRAPPSFPR